MTSRIRKIGPTSALFAALAATGCLPPDTRPEPARIYITADLPTVLRETQAADGRLGFPSADGWSITIERLTVSMGNAGLSGTSCNQYTEAGYRRVLDALQPGPQKVVQIWGLNGCRVDYSLGAPPTSDAVVGQGVSTSELDLMASALVPTSTPTGMTTVQGMAMHLVGSAAKGTTVVAFDWGFSSRIRFSDCKRLVNGKFEDTLPLVGGQTTSVNIQIDPRQFFSASPPRSGSTFIADTTSDADTGTTQAPAAADAGLNADAGSNADAATTLPSAEQPAIASIALMQLMADADQITGNANGHISIEELAKVPMAGDSSVLAQIPGATTNLAEALRQASYPAMFVYGDGGLCDIDVRQGGGRRGHM